eukprot:TRINITY_DN13336_c0_g1_i1.p1 TRINITY_DN13336_c0_g1~~TRINITY_DN13336_c0_g1_i1.p1  ORF type:complete len:436 (-),score=138.31 TRINITY_DN13336_c0_g1_i1:302-1609(-)
MPSLISVESIRSIGESLGVANPRDEVCAKLAEDTEFRTREVIQEAAKFMRHSKRTRLTPADVNNALRTLNVEPLYGYSSSDPDRLRFGHAASSSLYYTSDKEIPLSEVTHMELPEAPLEPALQCHWLAVEGLQPRSHHNPTPDSDWDSSKSKKRKLEDANVQVKTKVKHVLSKELQLFFQQVVNAVKAPGTELQKHVFKAVSQEAGLHQLLPYLSQLVAEEVGKSLRNLEQLFSLMHLVGAVLANKDQLHVEPYLHQLMPPVLTCLVGKSLCHAPTQDHWALREFAASLVHIVCSRFGTAYPSLQPRITRTLIHTLLDPLKPLTSHYGAIVGLTALGADTVRTLLAPNLLFYSKLLQPELEHTGTQKSFEANKCFAALNAAVGLLLHHTPFAMAQGQQDGERVEWEQLAAMFGESLRSYSEGSSAEQPGLAGVLL